MNEEKKLMRLPDEPELPLGKISDRYSKTIRDEGDNS
jgi:hypothetical protein